MKLYISSAGIKKVTISNSGLGVGKETPTPVRRVPSRTVLLVVILLAIFLPFVFVRIAFLVLESVTSCNSPLDCMRWRLFSGSDTSLKLREELAQALVEVKDGDDNRGRTESTLESFNDLVKEMTSKRQDVKAFAFETKAMIMRMEQKVQSARQHELIYWHLASHNIPKTLNCFCLRLTEEYSVNAMARARLPPPEHVSRLTDPSFHHVALLTDNILAASVVISSTLQNAADPKKLVFHIVTDKKTYPPMHAWFAVNSLPSQVVEVKGLHQYDWSETVNVEVKEMMEIHGKIWRHHYNKLKEDSNFQGGHERSLQALGPSSLSLLNHFRIYMHELFPDLNKIVFLDDDVVVQKDISSLWELDLHGKVLGAVVDSWCGKTCCPGRQYKDYFNFSHPIISSSHDPSHCAWLSGMNIFDLAAWRQINITEAYHKWLKLSLDSGLQLWQPGVLPPALLAFEGFVQPIDPLWHVSGLGFRSIEALKGTLESAAVLHFSGPAKPWLEIGNPEVRNLWYRHVNSSNNFIRNCRILK